MQKLILIILFISFSSLSFSQTIEYKTFSYSEFFQMIEEEEDTVFELQDAIIWFNPISDSLFDSNNPNKNIQLKVIDKKIQLHNIHFQNNSTGTKGRIQNIRFKQSVEINQAVSLHIHNCTFQEQFNSSNNFSKLDIPNVQEIENNIGYTVEKCRFLKGLSILYSFTENERYESFNFDGNEVWLNKPNQHGTGSFIFVENMGGLNFINNKFHNNSHLLVNSSKNIGNYFGGNEFYNLATNISIPFSPRTLMNKFELNKFENYLNLFITELGSNADIAWTEFSSKLNDLMAFNNFEHRKMAVADSTYNKANGSQLKKAFELYQNYKIENEKAFNAEMGLRSIFYNHYKSKFNNTDANAVYLEMKDMETARLEYLFEQSPTFDTFFTLKINQFLKIFSDYGTKPSKAIVFSLYVIFLFAFIYLLFPNSWDVHGKNRIIHRFTFFMKYMNRNQGIHEVYLEDKQPELMEYAEYKSLIENTANKVPGFFKATALPLYRWAISGTRITASLLSRVDVMKGTWEDVPAKNRWWKFILLIGAFLVAIIYDMIIKILNALMLSVNTFTTLGFGEIPIKGLPRYLAIIQGFIGWFMLTIFSVSLISQLLN